jgi:hypothetical protein
VERLKQPPVNVRTLSSWRQIVDVIDDLMDQSWVFRGHERSGWTLRTTLEREFTNRGDVERQTLMHFLRSAPRLLPGHLIPGDFDAAAWLGLIQHYGGPTRLLDVTRSPYVALYFAFEASGNNDRALWAIDQQWCRWSVAEIMAANEGIAVGLGNSRTLGAQAQLVYSVVHGVPPGNEPQFVSFKPFQGVFTLDPWRPDPRQSAQQAMFLCPGNVESSFMQNLAAHGHPKRKVLHKFVLPASLREEVIHQLSRMNVTAATLFPDLGGLARSLRTLTIRRWKTDAPPTGEPQE